MKARNRKSARPSREQGPQCDSYGIPEHAAEPPRELEAADARASPDDISALPFDFSRLREAERRLDGDLAEIEEQIWSRLQEALKLGDHARPRASATPMAELIDSILREDRVFIVRQIAGFGVPPSDVDDVTQDVLAGAIRSLSRYDTSRGKLRTWLYRVAYYQSQSFLGRAYRRREALEAAPPEASSEALGPTLRVANPEEQTILNEERRLVWDLIETIEVGRRAVFIGYEIMEVSMKEIAQALGIPMSTAWSQLLQARKEFMVALRRHRAREAFISARRRR